MKTFIFGILFFICSQIQSQTNYNDVAVIVNDSSQHSIDIANYFQLKRNIPSQNMIHISCTQNEEINDVEFENIRQQIETYLIANNIKDSINYIVSTKGVPLKINRGNCTDGGSACASFDSEITLILSSDSLAIGGAGLVFNYYKNSNQHFSKTIFNMYLVTRLDGYTTQDVIQLIDRSGPDTYVNKTSSQFIFDIASCDSSTFTFYSNYYIPDAMDSLTNNVWNTFFDQDTFLLQNADSVLGYYLLDFSIGNSQPNHQFIQASIGDLPASFSANTFDSAKNPNQNLILANLITQGLTGGHGQVYTVYVVPHGLDPRILISKYADTLKHYNLAESFYMSMPLLSSSSVVIGDPKSSISLINPNTIVNEKNNFNSLLIFPNPTNGHFTIQTENIESIEVLNSIGQSVYSNSFTNFEPMNKIDINLSNFANGIYFIQVNTLKEIKSQKILLQR